MNSQIIRAITRKEPEITQSYGRTPWSVGGGAGMYAYGREFCLNNSEHPGIDIGGKRHDPIYTPVAGRVLVAGASGVYRDDPSGNKARTGECRLQLDNGDLVIFGHLARIDVGVGDRVKAGQQLGTMGTANGDHIHLEYRTRSSACRSGWKIVEPSMALAIRAGDLPTQPGPPGASPTTPGTAPAYPIGNRPVVTADGWLGLAQRLAEAEYLLGWQEGDTLDVLAQNTRALLVRGTICLIGGLMIFKGSTR